MKKKLALITALLYTVFVFAQNTEELQNDETTNIVEDVGTPKKESWFKDFQISISYAPYIMIEPYYEGSATMFANGFQINLVQLNKKGLNQVKWGYIWNYGFHFPSSITIDSNGESYEIDVSNVECFLMDINLGMAIAFNSFSQMETGIDFFWLSITNVRTTGNLGFYVRGGLDVNMSKNVALSLGLKASMSVNWIFDDDKVPEFGIIPSAGIKFKF